MIAMTRLAAAVSAVVMLGAPVQAAVFDLTLSDFLFDNGATAAPSSISFQAMTTSDPIFQLDYVGVAPVFDIEISSLSFPVTFDSGRVSYSSGGVTLSSGFFGAGTFADASVNISADLSLTLTPADIAVIDSLAVDDVFAILGQLYLYTDEQDLLTGERSTADIYGTVLFSGQILEATPVPPSAVIPLPASLPLVAGGLAALGLIARRPRSRDLAKDLS